MQSTTDISGAVYTSAEVGALFRVSAATVNRWARAGKLGAFRVGADGDWRFPRATVDRILTSDSQEA